MFYQRYVKTLNMRTDLFQAGLFRLVAFEILPNETARRSGAEGIRKHAKKCNSTMQFCFLQQEATLTMQFVNARQRTLEEKAPH
uniref:GLOBIN domain-containing protein n=1 Tax=Ascaris lumbricoides TaxID=6252 RepID=A0A0M3HQ68_ASCLU